MNLKRLSIAAIQAVGLGLLPAGALAADINHTATFTGNVPGNCSYTSGTSQDVDLSYSNANNGTFTGLSQPIQFTCNTNAVLTLNGATQSGNPTPTDTVVKLLDATNADAEIIQVENTGTATTPFTDESGNGSVKIDLSATNASVPGSYTYVVVLTTTFS